jgi:predicted kinase
VRECIILIGLPGSGKTTFYRQRFAGTHAHVSKDLWPNVRNKNARQAQELSARLSSGASVVVDNTNAAMADRAPVIALARRHGAKVVGYFVDVPVKDALARNSGRDGRERVPNVAIYTIARRLEPPSPAEGFDELYRVQPAGDGEFTVERLLTAPESPSER